jgi:hypothetical protein
VNETVRGLVLLASVLLWLPFLPALLAGDLTLEQGLLRYGCALLLAWAGGSGLSALLRTYIAQGEQRAAEDLERAQSQRRRAEDHAPATED